jgi:hypothetical protein
MKLPVTARVLSGVGALTYGGVGTLAALMSLTPMAIFIYDNPNGRNALWHLAIFGMVPIAFSSAFSLSSLARLGYLEARTTSTSDLTMAVLATPTYAGILFSHELTTMAKTHFRRQEGEKPSNDQPK